MKMEIWFIIVISISISALVKAFFNLFFPIKTLSHKLPPGPSVFPVIGNFNFLGKSQLQLESIIKNLHSKYGPIINLPIFSTPSIFISDRSLAHQVLIQNGAVSADRPPANPVTKVTSSDQHNINSAPYGPTWRLLRRNLTANILHPSRVKSYSHARNWVLRILKDGMESESSKSNGSVRVIDHFQYAMFCLLVLMCFGDKLDEKKIKEIEDVQRQVLLNLRRFNLLNLWPRVTKILFRKRWEELFEIKRKEASVLLPLIRERRKLKQEKLDKKTSVNDDDDVDDEYVLSYVDTLFDLQLPEEKRNLNEKEIISLCSEFLSAGTDSTSTALQWIMANLVKYPHIQETLFEEIKRVVGEGEKEVKEEDLQKMPYLKAVVLEGLRRHPPVRFVVPHAVTEDVVLGGFWIPKHTSINFLVSEMAWDENAWEDPMSFKPERFMGKKGEGDEVLFDITGSREIKMMPFGVGRRICPGLGLAILHLEYFVANFIWCYEWKAVNGGEISLDEKHEFTIVMKNPLQPQIIPRSN